MHLIPRYVNDGTCRMLNALLKYTDLTRFQVSVGILSRDDVSVQPLVDLGAEPVQFEMRHFADLSVINPVARELAERRIQVLHTHRVRPDIVGRVAGHRAGVPVNVSTQHYLGEWQERGRLIGFLVRMLYKHTLPYTQSIVNISATEMALMREMNIPAEKLEVIYNGVDGDAFYPEKDLGTTQVFQAEDESPVIGAVAYLTKRKGMHHLVAAFRRVADRFPRARLKIVGDGEERQALERQVRMLGLADQVALLGNRSDIRSLMNGFDVFVLPSLWEPFGLVIAEAMACSRPVVATNVGGIPEIVEDGVSGILVPPANADRLAEALIALLLDDGRRRDMGRAGRKRFLEQFDAGIMSTKYQTLYVRLLSDEKRRKGFGEQRGFHEQDL